MDLLYFLRVLYRKKWIIFFLTFLALVAAFVFLLFKKPLYESVAQYSTGFTADKVKLTDGSSIADLYTADTKFDNVIETFKSPRVLGMISYKLLLNDLENPAKPYRHLTDKQKQSAIYKSVNKEAAMQILRNKISKGELLRSDDEAEKRLLELLKLYNYDYAGLTKYLFIVRVEKTDYLDIVFRSENPELSAWVVNAMGTEFLNYYQNLNFQRTEENVQNIKELEKLQAKKVDSLSNVLLAEKQSQGTIDPVSRSTSAMETVKDIEGKLAEEKSKYDEHYNRLQYLQNNLKTIQSATGNLSGNNSEVVKLMDKQHKLEADLIAKGGNDADLQRQIKDIRAEINQKSNSGVSKAKATEDISELQNKINEEDALMKAAQSTITDYNAKIRYYMGLTNVNPGSNVKIDVIRDKLDLEQKQLANIKDKLNQAEGLSKDDPTANFKRTLLGQPAVEPEPKKSIITMGISGVSMFFLSSFIFLFLEIFNASIKTPYGFEKLVKLKLISVINSIRLKSKNVSEIMLDEGNENPGSSENLYKNNIRKLRYELGVSGIKTFLFTSTQRKTGKSTIIEALAYSFLLNKKKVLIMDLNMHNNTLTQKFNANILIQDLSEKINPNLSLAMQGVTGNTLMENLDIIGCKEGSLTPSEALFKLDMASLIRFLEEKYDFIFIEGSSLNNYADSKELVQYAGGVVSVFSAEYAVTQTDKSSIQFLQGLKEKNLGAVLNNVLPENLNF
ncbi:MAG: Wzz/FepE/Etk N-terminal domain-containing protein [Bacteroidota bacterium]|nr:Wzz/FepE/Etk N-terminal domain-containing protein [Bacteroidota bacterium]